LLTPDFTDFDVTITGFAVSEIDLIIQDASHIADSDEQLPVEEAGTVVSHAPLA
jgi:hypothetical protein